MRIRFQAEGRPMFVGSLPLEDHEEAADWVFKFIPQMPLWIQLPGNPVESMVPQFMPGLPGYRAENSSAVLETDSEDFEQELVGFYEEYLAVQSGDLPADRSRFVLSPDVARGFYVLNQRLEQASEPPLAVKGQVTGPFTFATGIRDAENRAIFYSDQLRDAAVKLLAMKAAWQTARLARHDRPVIVFIDEPALAGFGSSEYISVSPDDVRQCLAEVIDAIQAAGGLAGVHVCANTEWSLVLDSGADMLSFDAYGYFDKLILYRDALQRFVGSGGILSWGIVPTLQVEALRNETVETLHATYREQVGRLVRMGFDPGQLFRQTLISTSCGAGSLSRENAARVLEMTAQLSARVRDGAFQT